MNDSGMKDYISSFRLNRTKNMEFSFSLSFILCNEPFSKLCPVSVCSVIKNTKSSSI